MADEHRRSEPRMGNGGLAKDRLVRLHEIIEGHVAEGRAPGAVWALARRGQVEIGTVGSVGPSSPGIAGAALARDSIFRISSMTKPVTAVAALILVEECRLRLDDPVDDLLPELADRQVMREVDGDIDDTVPADRPITLRDLLTFRLGWGMDFTFARPQTVLAKAAELGLGGGPPAPQANPGPDEWIRRLGTLPLDFQPGERWLYHTGADVLGVLIARASGRSLPDFLHERVFEPLGMTDTAFFVPPEKAARFGAELATDPSTGETAVYDPADGQWSTAPAFAGGGDGLVSTLDDYLAFAGMLLAGGSAGGSRILSRPSVAAMTTDQLTAANHAVSGPSPDGSTGWGFGVGVQVLPTSPRRSLGAYGWDGGLGTSWANDPREGMVGVLLTHQAWTSPALPPLFQDFWTGAYAAIDG